MSKIEHIAPHARHHLRCWRAIIHLLNFTANQLKEHTLPFIPQHNVSVHQYSNRLHRTCSGARPLQFIAGKYFSVLRENKSSLSRRKNTQNPRDVNGRKHPLSAVQKQRIRGDAGFSIPVKKRFRAWHIKSQSPVKQRCLLYVCKKKVSAESLSISILSLFDKANLLSRLSRRRRFCVLQRFQRLELRLACRTREAIRGLWVSQHCLT